MWLGKSKNNLGLNDLYLALEKTSRVDRYIPGRPSAPSRCFLSRVWLAVYPADKVGNRVVVGLASAVEVDTLCLLFLWG